MLVLSRLAAVDSRLAVLLAVGAAVCGNSAVVATSPVIGARPRDTAYAVATVTLFGTIAVFAYPLIGHAAHLGDAVFGLWAGIAINDTSQVVAASSAYSPGAFEVATVVKLIRNALMAPLLLGDRVGLEPADRQPPATRGPASGAPCRCSCSDSSRCPPCGASA